MASDYDRAMREHRVDLLFVDAQIVAVRAADHLLLENVAVSSGFQGRGCGRLMLDHAERLASSLGLAELKLYTNKQFSPNLEIYRRLGYSIYSEEPFMGGFVVQTCASASLPLTSVALKGRKMTARAENADNVGRRSLARCVMLRHISERATYEGKSR